MVWKPYWAVIGWDNLVKGVQRFWSCFRGGGFWRVERVVIPVLVTGLRSKSNKRCESGVTMTTRESLLYLRVGRAVSGRFENLVHRMRGISQLEGRCFV